MDTHEGLRTHTSTMTLPNHTECGLCGICLSQMSNFYQCIDEASMYLERITLRQTPWQCRAIWHRSLPPIPHSFPRGVPRWPSPRW